MSDLISRSEVNNVIDKLEVYTCGRPNTMKVEISVLQLQRFINKLKNIPTAYDPDKVVAEFEKIRAKETCNKEKCDAKEICRICVVDDAIEIVKQGGVSDDVCEWKSASDGEFIQNPHTKRLYSNEPSMKNVYCNTCGKKIRIVGD